MLLYPYCHCDSLGVRPLTYFATIVLALKPSEKPQRALQRRAMLVQAQPMPCALIHADALRRRENSLRASRSLQFFKDFLVSRHRASHRDLPAAKVW